MKPGPLDGMTSLDLVLKVIHDAAVKRGEYRAKGDDESWYQWWRAYQHDVLGEGAS